jgi:hypothetical protein
MDCDSEDSMDEVKSDSDSDTSDEIWLFNTDHTSTSVQDLSTTTNLNNPIMHGHGTNNPGMDTFNDTGTSTSNIDNERPCTPRSPSPPLLIDEDDEDCGPVESGPLMNEVRLVGTRGQSVLSCVVPRCLIHSQHPRGNTLHHSARLV